MEGGELFARVRAHRMFFLLRSVLFVVATSAAAPILQAYLEFLISSSSLSWEHCSCFFEGSVLRSILYTLIRLASSDRSKPSSRVQSICEFVLLLDYCRF